MFNEEQVTFMGFRQETIMAGSHLLAGLLQFIMLSIIMYLSEQFVTISVMGTGACPSCQWVSSGVNPGQQQCEW